MIVSYLGTKGGTGTTTLAVNGAADIRRLTRRPSIIVDLKSTNGSRINGALLYAEIPVMLEDGDELCLGKLVFRVYFGV